MPDTIDVLRLGGFTFTGFSPPEILPVGGHQAMVIHKLPGGARVIDTLGRDDMDISWRGFFFENGAIDKCVQLDAMRRAGTVLPLTFCGQSRQVVIADFIYSVRRFPMWIEYSISCTVQQSAPSSGTSASSSGIDASASADAALGSSIAGSTNLWGAPPSGTLPGTEGGTFGAPPSGVL